MLPANMLFILGLLGTRGVVGAHSWSSHARMIGSLLLSDASSTLLCRLNLLGMCSAFFAQLALPSTCTARLRCVSCTRKPKQGRVAIPILVRYRTAVVAILRLLPVELGLFSIMPARLK